MQKKGQHILSLCTFKTSLQQVTNLIFYSLIQSRCLDLYPADNTIEYGSYGFAKHENKALPTWKGFSPVWTSWCLLSLLLSTNALLHSAHTWTRGPCVCKCFLIAELSLQKNTHSLTSTYVIWVRNRIKMRISRKKILHRTKLLKHV